MLGDLCRALARRGLYVQMRDAVPGLTVTRPGGTSLDVIGYVVVNRRKGEVSWWRVDTVHPVTDLDGAATAPHRTVPGRQIRETSGR